MENIFVINNIEEEIIRWLQGDKEARKAALDCCRPDVRLNRSWILLDMIESRFPGLRVGRENLFQENLKGIYLKVIEDKSHVLPPHIEQNNFVNNILLKLGPAEQSELRKFYTLDSSVYRLRRKPPLSWLDKTFILNALIKVQYQDLRDPDIRIRKDGTYYDAFELIHYLDLSKPLVPLPVKPGPPRVLGCVSRW